MLEIQHTQKICITFVQCWANVEDVGPTLYKCYRPTHVLCLLGSSTCFLLEGSTCLLLCHHMHCFLHYMIRCAAYKHVLTLRHKHCIVSGSIVFIDTSDYKTIIIISMPCIAFRCNPMHCFVSLCIVLLQHCIALFVTALLLMSLCCIGLSRVFSNITNISMKTIHQQLDVKIDCCCHVDNTNDCHLNVSRLDITKVLILVECHLFGNVSQLSGILTRHVNEDLNYQAHHTLMSQTPNTIIRHQTQSSDTKNKQQTLNTIIRHRKQSPNTERNHQTPNTIIRHQTQSSDTKHNHQTPNTIIRHQKTNNKH